MVLRILFPLFLIVLQWEAFAATDDAGGQPVAEKEVEGAVETEDRAIDRAEAEDLADDEEDKEKDKEGGKEVREEKPKSEGETKGAEGEEKAGEENVGKAGESESSDAKKVEAEPAEGEVNLVKGKTKGDDEEQQSEHYRHASLGTQFFKFPVTGSLWTRYRYRASGRDDDDQDISQNLWMDIGDKNRHAVTGHLDARWTHDLEGTRTGLRSEIFTEVVDTYSENTDFRLYSAYADFHKIPQIDFLRVGRQFMYETPEILQFDGVRLETDPFLGKHALKFGFYGGLPVHEYESSSQGDSVAGAHVEGRPFDQTRLRFDWTRIDDEMRRNHYQTSLQGGDRYLTDNLYSWSFWQKWKSPFVRLNGRFTMAHGKPREGVLRVLYNNPDLRLNVSASYTGWFKDQDRLVTEYDLFFDTLKSFEPNHSGILAVSKEWTDHIWMEVGAATKRLAGGGTEGRYNREYDRFHGTVQIRDLPAKNLTFGVSGFLYHGMSDAPDTREAGADVTYDWDKRNRTSAGTGYALYKFDVFTGEERDEVRSNYLRHRYKPTDWASLDLDYEYELSRADKWHTLRLTFRFNF